jgi:hypothetical protein
VEPEVQNIVYFGRPVTGISQDMSSVYRMMAQNPQNIKPVEPANAAGFSDTLVCHGNTSCDSEISSNDG